MKTWRNGKGDFSWGVEYLVGGKDKKFVLSGEKIGSGAFLLKLQW
jgi:hypothetical protein